MIGMKMAGFLYLYAVYMPILVNAEVCPYAKYSKTITVSHCKSPGALYCVVDWNCVEISAAFAVQTSQRYSTAYWNISENAEYIAEIPMTTEKIQYA